MTQSIKRVAIYTRVSTAEQSAERQERDLKSFAERSGFEIIATFTETASGARNDRQQRAKVMQLAREKHIDAVVVTELTRWGRSTADVISTMQQLAGWNVSLIAQTGLEFDLTSPQGKLMLTVLAGISEFERDLIRERTISGLATAKAKGKKLGRQSGQNVVQDKYAEKVPKFTNDKRSVRWIAQELHISPGTVQKIRATAKA